MVIVYRKPSLKTAFKDFLCRNPTNYHRFGSKSQIIHIQTQILKIPTNNMNF